MFDRKTLFMEKTPNTSSGLKKDEAHLRQWLAYYMIWDLPKLIRRHRKTLGETWK